MRGLALALVLLVSTLPVAHGLISNMAVPPGSLRAPLRRHPAPDAHGFRLDEIHSPWSARPPRGEILDLGFYSATIGIHIADAWAASKPIPDGRWAEITTEICHFLRIFIKNGQLGGRLLPMADNNFANFSLPLQWAPFPLPFAPYY